MDEGITNISIPGKCECCPHMFEHKCRADKCIYNNEICELCGETAFGNSVLKFQMFKNEKCQEYSLCKRCIEDLEAWIMAKKLIYHIGIKGNKYENKQGD